MKKRVMLRMMLFSILLSLLTVNVSAASKVDLILDWVPNTNHTGLYVAKAKGYFDAIGVDLEIRRPPEGSTTELVGLGQAQFGISFQDSLAHRFAKGLPVTAVAAILEHNTSGVISNESTNIKSPKDMAGFKYGTWNDPTELAMLKYIIELDGGDYSKMELVPNQADNSVVGLANNQFDAAWIYYAWDGIMAEHQKVPTNFFFFKDYAKELDFYSPVIIANNDYLSKQPEQAKTILQAIKKGYQYAAEHPEEAADILIQAAPELKDQRDFVVASQKWIAAHYADDVSKWGVIDKTRWDSFYQWLVDHELVDKTLLDGTYFDNSFIQ
ncbi:ABC transporter substrate-binding protein [Aerococcaceae bacterium zg-ZUI334]|uniref:ABC transporter substrate-binding protein n=1 Tax=Aerococcaceae bacterium zg-252 TaxID=2796928 RepID=UPI001BA3893C|nr:ABC transporter substrate-binding protein [Aerococcaceae bacterium zg-ZUI334]